MYLAAKAISDAVVGTNRPMVWETQFENDLLKIVDEIKACDTNDSKQVQFL